MRSLIPVLSLALAACVVRTAEPVEPGPPPPEPAAEERVAASPPPDDERVPATRPPPPANETVGATRPTAPPAPPAARPNENVPASRPPTAPPAPPAARPNENVPARRPATRPFSIEPTAGPVKTTVTIYGDFTMARSPADLLVQFAGADSAKPRTVAADHITAIVPPKAQTGAVRVTLRRKVVFTGGFAVTGTDDGLLDPTEAGEGLLGLVYQLPPKTKQLPNFAMLGQPFATITVPALKVTARRFDAGFPGLEASGEKLLEWFAIRFEGALMVPSDGEYTLRVVSDDGAKVYLDGALVIDNDGVHAPRARDSARLQLTAGRHEVVVEYFQGPRYQIALELQWKQPQQKKFDTIDKKFFKR
ncbi:MAG TPA: PA14 domain-containing protein [Kofleriaceae bacterium]|nr:PA14 domain-containing protein [Kofleriaceae bacterium]